MTKISTNKAFKEALSSLSLSQQRQLSARFIQNVLDLTDGRCTEHAQQIASKSNPTAEELSNAYHAVHAIYVATNPRSGFSELDFKKQAAHFVSEACMLSVAPTYHEATQHHLAEKVAMYCCMARTCASIQHEDEYPKFVNAEETLKNEVDAQYRILNEFLD